MSNGADRNQTSDSRETRGMRGDVMQTRGSCMGPTVLPTDPLVCVVVWARRG